jgi:SNF2 family DNA or RNA helicase
MIPQVETYNPWPYQAFAEQHVLDNLGSMLILDMGLGKTVITLTAIDKLMFELLEVTKVLVVAPKSVAECVWSDEAAKWDHLKHLRFSIVLGNEKQRKEALKAKADIYVINRDNIAWLVAQYGSKLPFDMVVLDESSSFKNPKSGRFKSMKTGRPCVKRIALLTGTPLPNGLLDFWSQMFLIDRGQRLGDEFERYRDKYFKKAEREPGTPAFGYELRTFANPRPKNGLYDNESWDRKIMHDVFGRDYWEAEIYDKIRDVCVSMKAEDYLQLPERIDRVVRINLPHEIKEQYDEFERKLVLELTEQDTITAINAAGLTNKLLQFSNGAVYDAERNVHEVHCEKLDKLEEIIECANGQPVLVFYSYQHDLSRMKERLKSYKPVELRDGADGKLKSKVAAWNSKKFRVMLAHPASAGHGLNLQAGGNIIVWFGLPWSLELYMQANARLHRQGQTKPVVIHHLVANGTMDEDVMAALSGKADQQNALMRAVKARIEKYTK